MSGFLQSRQREEEWMDAPDVDPEQLRLSLRFIRRINAFLRYPQVTLWHLTRLSRHWKKGEKISILDLATGSGDIPRAILNWARRRRFNLRMIAVDLHAETIRVAAALDPELKAARADARQLPFADKSVDYAHTAMFIHHLDEADVVSVLKEMDRVARRGIIVTDLIRSSRAYRWITLFTLFANPMVVHDARVSVAQAFTEREIMDLFQAVGIRYVRYRRHFGHRFVVAGERGIDH
jgi:ubiquinone/menaquinone biosynthesis C-methylase UbiE